MHAGEGRPVPRVVRLATPAVIAQMKQRAPTALAITPPSVTAALNGPVHNLYLCHAPFYRLRTNK